MHLVIGIIYIPSFLLAFDPEKAACSRQGKELQMKEQEKVTRISAD